MNVAERDAALAKAEQVYRDSMAPYKEKFREAEKQARRAYDDIVADSQAVMSAALEAAKSEEEMQAARDAHTADIAKAQAAYDEVIAEQRDLVSARDMRLQAEQDAARKAIWDQFHAEHPEAILQQ